MQKKEYWDHIYNTKSPGEVSWTQAGPQPSITSAGISKSAPIIDIGGGESQLADRLLDLGTPISPYWIFLHNPWKKLGQD